MDRHHRLEEPQRKANCARLRATPLDGGDRRENRHQRTCPRGATHKHLSEAARLESTRTDTFRRLSSDGRHLGSNPALFPKKPAPEEQRLVAESFVNFQPRI